MTIDAHIDAPWLFYKWGDRDLLEVQPDRAVDIPRMMEGGLDGAFFSIYLSDKVQDSLSAEAIDEEVNRQIEWVDNLFIRSGATLYAGLEGGRLIRGSLDRLTTLAHAGISYLTLTHNYDTDWCDSATDVGRNGGITDFGVEVVLHCEAYEIPVDVSHSSSNVLEQVCGMSRRPVLATHSGVRALCDHVRNLTDQEIQRIASTGGVVGVPFVRKFLGDHSPADHVDHIAQLLGGVSHIGIGSDLDGADCIIDSVSNWRVVVHEALLKKGYSMGDIELIAGENWLRMIGEETKE